MALSQQFEQLASNRIGSEALQILIQLQSQGSIEEFRQFLNVTLINSVNFQRDSFTDASRFYISFLSLKEISMPYMKAKFELDVTNLMIDSSTFIRKTVNQNQYFIILIDKFIQSGDMNIINQLRYSFRCKTKILEKRFRF
jgi:hypothetical protein